MTFGCRRPSPDARNGTGSAVCFYAGIKDDCFVEEWVVEDGLLKGRELGRKSWVCTKK